MQLDLARGDKTLNHRQRFMPRISLFMDLVDLGNEEVLSC